MFAAAILVGPTYAVLPKRYTREGVSKMAAMVTTKMLRYLRKKPN